MTTACRVTLFGGLKDAAGKDNVHLDLPEGAVLENVFEVLIELYGRPMEVQLKNTLNGQYVDYLVIINQRPIMLRHNLNYVIQDGDEMAILVICAGG